MEEDINFWSKKSDELTTADQLKLAALIPVAMMAGFYVPALVVSGVKNIRTRFANRKQTPLTLVETIAEEVE